MKKKKEKNRNLLGLEQEGVEKVDFDTWYALRKDSIPGHHHKEILKADFKGRGINGDRSMETFDKALAAYGIVLG
jgi:hypothetical protein